MPLGRSGDPGGTDMGHKALVYTDEMILLGDNIDTIK
jgi:hypothetical protein